ncbi:MAG: aminopeptidase, partial [Desulfuromonadales bacterium]
LLAACVDIGYYAQCATGHLEVINRCRPIPEILAESQTSPELRDKLKAVQSIREFAVQELDLPDNDSYRSYGDLGRPYVVWNVVAAGEFSLTPEQWCFPVAGCVAYRGYFSRDSAENFAATLRKKDFDVYVYGVEAYSTLNWFDDPVLNTFLDRSEPSLAGLIFHELSHQVAYAQNDSRFNEAFATTVELEGVKRWLKKEGDEDSLSRLQAGLKRQRQFLELLHGLRKELQVLYEQETDPRRLKKGKADIMAKANGDYETLKKEWGGFEGYDRFFTGGLNNAKLVSVSTYQDLVPSFQRLLARFDGKLSEFYREVDRLASLSPEKRLTSLAAGDVRLAESERRQSGPTE